MPMDSDAPAAERLERFLVEVAPELGATVTSLSPISGGYSRVTSVAQIRRADGVGQKLVLRSDPPSGHGVFDSDRDDEWPLLLALWEVDAVDIARPRFYDATGEWLGSKTIVMDHVEGTPLQLTLGPDADVGAARSTFLKIAASLQRIPLGALPPGMHRPRNWETYIDGAIDIYDRAERELGDSNPVVRFVAGWLRGNRPASVPLGVVHGDFQPGNILIGDGHPPVVIDWEFARIGDPREDIGYYSGSPLPNSLYNADPEAFLHEYRELTGYNDEQVNQEVMEYFFILGMAELFAQMLQGADALTRGNRAGIMAPFLVNSLCYFQERFFGICTR
jgi:aminoglycoside phosphotransferase (APT) family kinase protein